MKKKKIKVILCLVVLAGIIIFGIHYKVSHVSTLNFGHVSLIKSDSKLLFKKKIEPKVKQRKEIYSRNISEKDISEDAIAQYFLSLLHEGYSSNTITYSYDRSTSFLKKELKKEKNLSVYRRKNLSGNYFNRIVVNIVKKDGVYEFTIIESYQIQ
ncbi:hypothetical protein ACFFIF_10925 [Vagococcus entomophilus]|uniref:Uncharacterized protein n=1 Tax=Vagococcus entomophilus TaxID=1160095 RepID=A0A430AF47_9ENTE|nr:hypothetical protein [Vagococcus entomophilus]RSU06200.1 hypothetical protein CBF30_10815 [Vagococcus entomophilus]